MMSLGTYEFQLYPSDVSPIIIPKRHVASVETYGGVAFFSWGPSIIGLAVTLYWRLIPTAMWEKLNELYQADAQVVWDPDDGESTSYNVEITNLIGSYFLYLANTTGHYRRDVSLDLLVISEAS